ncbi:MAG: hypothetical protein CME70_15700 [Halobacteriovorax sp.]|nr:hypothetical protein [Halobacteriovorax sp.]|tara:strand:- start:4026 stop:4934 length:909 start_codon:yes stop_codon:yes gene_type:complete
MELSPNFQNSGLLENKLNLLKKLELDFVKKTCSDLVVSYRFHGFCLRFHGDKNFVLQITSNLPQTWKLDTPLEGESFLDIYLTNNWGEDWDLEENPDCLIKKTELGETAIQRDFVGIDNVAKALVSLDEVQSDGIFNCLRWLLPRRLLSKGYFLLHSSCVVTNNKAQFFLGHSGAGKSTIATMAEDRMVLGDDMNIMRYENGEVYARAGGLGGLSFDSTDFSKEFPVSGFYWLNQSHIDSKEDLEVAAAVSKFMASLANIFWEYLDAKEREELLDLATKVVSSCPFYKLNFTKSKECWNNVI